MRQLIRWNLITLDGYFEGAQPWDLDWDNELPACTALAEAVALASTHPMAAVGTLEVRPVWEELPGPARYGGGRRGAA